ncbi:MAG: GNAT family N-acetyltransferase [Merismopedia sp. SIO2A8]|nr:GNAT family N-acetyltransferase [Merismopedia sp. SIO2A8]
MSTSASTLSSAQRYGFELARSPQEVQAYFDLRKAIFCGEQQLFTDHDKDEVDDYAYPIIAIDRQRETSQQDTSQQPDKVVGVVRIYETQPRHWYGGRLGVDVNYRRVGRIGKGLIYKAVTTANTWGCDRFLATVQLQNVRFFRRLHWESIDEIQVCDRPHHLMEADLNFYPPGNEIRPTVRSTEISLKHSPTLRRVG